MKRFFKKLTYKTLFIYSLVIIALLIVAVPVFATANPANKLLDFALNTKTGLSAQDARVLNQGINVDHLNSGQEHWYTYSHDNFNDPTFTWISLALRYQSEAVISPDQVNFQILTQPASGSWFEAAAMPQDVLGEGQRSPLKTANQSLTESFWTGQVAEQTQYYVRVFNNSPFGLDYTLETKAQKPALPSAIPASLNTAIANNDTLNTRQLVWTLTAMAVAKMPADKASDWMQQAQAVGWIVTANTPTDKTPKPHQADPQVLWSLAARAVEGQDAQSAAMWLIQADSLGWLSIPMPTIKKPDTSDDEGNNKDGGDDGTNSSAKPPQTLENYVPVNIYPNEPLDFDINHVNSGRLGPFGEHWYSLRRDDLDKVKFEDMALTMFFTPLVGYMSQRVNFELFPASQYHIWARGDADYMQNFGAGAWVSRDKDSKTGERLWKGSLVDGDTYLIKVKNGTPDVVDYYLFPGDIENAELGNPTLHQAKGGQAVGPSLSPPTKPSLPPEPGAGPPEAIPLKVGLTKDTLAAGEERWYKIEYLDTHNDTTPSHDFIFYLTNTPLDYIRSRHADFAIYRGDQLGTWTRGDTDKLKPLGTSGYSPNKTKNRQSLQVLWRGQLMEKQTYYVKVYNHDLGPLEYELEIQGGP